MIEINTSNGTRTIHLGHFPAIDGWDIQNRFLEFAASSDKTLRKAYLMEVLSYARVEIHGAADHMQFATDAIVNNHLETWTNIQIVFEAVLRHNGIDPNTHAKKTAFWSDAGEEMAISFLAACSKMIGPAMEMAEKLNKVD